ncbi:MAG: phosphoheptose isomerase [Chlorobi bacterium OLB5]|nr:MAG: phosphoheptose isomerase [Chlorobi bacterium OLB5]
MDLKSYKRMLYDAVDSVDTKEITAFTDLLFDAYKNDKFVFVIGNGGSSANASHLAQDLAKGTKLHPEHSIRLKALSLTDNTPFLTAQANDEGYDTIFEQQLVTYAKPGDIVIAISGSGNSPNIVKAIEWANNNGLISIGVTGYDGGKLYKIAHHKLHVPLNEMCTAESIHTIIFHYVILELREKVKEHHKNN